jgi:phenylalanyl-tRNA synthetase beta chain
MNPVAPENRYLRNSLFPSLLKTIAKNPTFPEIAIFEIGHIYDKKNGERTFLGVGLAGDKIDLMAKMVDKINQSAGNCLKWEIKELSADERRRYKIKKAKVSLAQADLGQFLITKPMKDEMQLPKDVNYREISKYPSVTRDAAFIIDASISADEVKKLVLNISPLIVQAELFDEFASDKIGKGKKNVAYHLQFQAKDHTLTKKEADILFDQIVKTLTGKLKATLRDK